MSDTRYYLKLLFLISVLVISSFIAYDIRLNSSFQRSSTGKFLHQSGFITSFRNLNKIFFQQIMSLSVSINDLKQLIFSKCTIAFTAIWDAIIPLRIWLEKTIPSFIETIDEYLPIIHFKIQSAVQICTEYLIFISEYITDASQDLSIWLQDNIFIGPLAPEKLKQSFIDLVDYFQKYASQGAEWVQKQYQILVG